MDILGRVFLSTSCIIFIIFQLAQWTGFNSLTQYSSFNLLSVQAQKHYSRESHLDTYLDEEDKLQNFKENNDVPLYHDSPYVRQLVTRESFLEEIEGLSGLPTEVGIEAIRATVYYIGYCPHCIDFARVWNEVASSRVSFKNIRFLAVNCDVSEVDGKELNALCNEQQITKYPTVVYYRVDGVEPNARQIERETDTNPTLQSVNGWFEKLGYPSKYRNYKNSGVGPFQGSFRSSNARRLASYWEGDDCDAFHGSSEKIWNTLHRSHNAMVARLRNCGVFSHFPYLFSGSNESYGKNVSTTPNAEKYPASVTLKDENSNRKSEVSNAKPSDSKPPSKTIISTNASAFESPSSRNVKNNVSNAKPSKNNPLSMVSRKNFTIEDRFFFRGTEERGSAAHFFDYDRDRYMAHPSGNLLLARGEHDTRLMFAMSGLTYALSHMVMRKSDASISDEKLRVLLHFLIMVRRNVPMKKHQNAIRRFTEGVFGYRRTYTLTGEAYHSLLIPLAREIDYPPAPGVQFHPLASLWTLFHLLVNFYSYRDNAERRSCHTISSRHLNAIQSCIDHAMEENGVTSTPSYVLSNSLRMMHAIHKYGDSVNQSQLLTSRVSFSRMLAQLDRNDYVAGENDGHGRVPSSVDELLPFLSFGRRDPSYVDLESKQLSIAIGRFVITFLGCEKCRTHFASLYEKFLFPENVTLGTAKILEEQGKREFMWNSQGDFLNLQLWRLHNLITLHAAIERLQSYIEQTMSHNQQTFDMVIASMPEDMRRLLAYDNRFPSKELCPSCRTTSLKSPLIPIHVLKTLVEGTPEEKAAIDLDVVADRFDGFDLREVLRFLPRFYCRPSWVTEDDDFDLRLRASWNRLRRN